MREISISVRHTAKSTSEVGVYTPNLTKFFELKGCKQTSKEKCWTLYCYRLKMKGVV